MPSALFKGLWHVCSAYLHHFIEQNIVASAEIQSCVDSLTMVGVGLSVSM